MTSAECMKRLREKRKQQGKCTRCGKLIVNGRCSACDEYRKKYNEVVKARRRENFISVGRKLKTWKVSNYTLYQLMLERKITTTDLGKALGTYGRTVQRWLYQGSIPKDEMKQKINDYFGEEVFDFHR